MVNVMVPVGFTPPESVAVSLTGVPTSAVGVAWVTMVVAAARTVVTSEPDPVPMVPSWWVPIANPIWLV
jgi:hypothetical protein